MSTMRAVFCKSYSIFSARLVYGGLNRLQKSQPKPVNRSMLQFIDGN